ncbi:chorismate mutase [Pantoea anthophila]|uniref:chorismate mutase n=1 Tax=Pantoea anthophila TaxID=470931 RepID=UPI002DB85021|nr:chorismate mutase [Pantoea anthophila]MEB5705605.1 chorismate mutase [Pantoea anthophila]MEB6516475.1 chorismate mutase [Pantoea anthophila]
MMFATLEEVRKEIDRIDVQLVSMIAQRAECVKAAATFKADHAAVRAPDRVQQVIDKVCRLAAEKGLPEVIIAKVYRSMIEAFIEYELAHHAQIGDNPPETVN